MREAGEDQHVVLGQRLGVGQVGLAQQVEGQARLHRLALRRHDQLAIGGQVEPVVGRGLRIDDAHAQVRRPRIGRKVARDHVGRIAAGQEGRVVHVGKDAHLIAEGHEVLADGQFHHLPVRADPRVQFAQPGAARPALIERRDAVRLDLDVVFDAVVGVAEDLVAGRPVQIGVQPNRRARLNAGRRDEGEDRAVVGHVAIQLGPVRVLGQQALVLPLGQRPVQAVVAERHRRLVARHEVGAEVVARQVDAVVDVGQHAHLVADAGDVLRHRDLEHRAVRAERRGQRGDQGFPGASGVQPRGPVGLELDVELGPPGRAEDLIARRGVEIRVQPDGRFLAEPRGRGQREHRRFRRHVAIDRRAAGRVLIQLAVLGPVAQHAVHGIGPGVDRRFRIGGGFRIGRRLGFRRRGRCGHRVRDQVRAPVIVGQEPLVVHVGIQAHGVPEPHQRVGDQEFGGFAVGAAHHLDVGHVARAEIRGLVKPGDPVAENFDPVFDTTDIAPHLLPRERVHVGVQPDRRAGADAGVRMQRQDGPVPGQTRIEPVAPRVGVQQVGRSPVGQVAVQRDRAGGGHLCVLEMPGFGHIGPRTAIIRSRLTSQLTIGLRGLCRLHGAVESLIPKDEIRVAPPPYAHDRRRRRADD